MRSGDTGCRKGRRDLGELLQRIGAHALRDGTSPAATALIIEW